MRTRLLPLVAAVALIAAAPLHAASALPPDDAVWTPSPVADHAGPLPLADLAPESRACAITLEICATPMDDGSTTRRTECRETLVIVPCKELTMTYATRADLVARFGAGEMDLLAPLDEADASARADAALADASAEFDAVLADGYDLPLPAGEYPLLKAAACDVARLRLYDEAAPDVVMGRASSARKRVGQVAAGALALVSGTGARVERRTGILIDAGEPVATRERLSGYLGDATTLSTTLRTG